jgi:hypothetical protein
VELSIVFNDPAKKVEVDAFLLGKSLESTNSSNSRLRSLNIVKIIILF